MELLTAGGLLGRCTSRSTLIPELARVVYRGHLVRERKKLTMEGCVEGSGAAASFSHPTILIVGSSMSAGKTMAARTLIRGLRTLDLRVLGAKVTGAGRYRDILAMGDTGATPILDFVDVGLTSTVCPEDEFREALEILMDRMAPAEVDVTVVVSGAVSPGAV